MSSFRIRHPSRRDARGAAAVVIAVEAALYGKTSYRESDLEAEWAALDLDQNVWVAEADARIVGYASLQDRGELARGDSYVLPGTADVGVALTELLERTAAARGARRLQLGVLERDDAARGLLDARGYRAVREFREMRIELDAPPAPPVWPEGLRGAEFDPDRDAHVFHAAQEEAFADHWEHRRREFGEWAKWHLEGAKFDPSLWCVVRDGDEIAAGAINVADLFGGGWVSVLFTRRPWRARGVGAALLQDAFTRFWDRGERSVGLGVDAQSDTGAFRLYERVGMTPVLGWVMYEKALRAA